MLCEKAVSGVQQQQTYDSHPLRASLRVALRLVPHAASPPLADGAMSGLLLRDSPRFTALEASVERLRSLAVHEPFQQMSPPAAVAVAAAHPAPASAAHWKESLHIQVAQPNHDEFVLDASQNMDEDVDLMDASSSSPPLSPVTQLAVPPSPTLPTRRLLHAPFRPSVSLPLRSESASGGVAALSRLRDWSPPSSVPSSPGSSCRASASPFSFHSPYADLHLQIHLQSQQPLAPAPHTPEPFCPVVPLLQQSGSDGALLGMEVPSSLTPPSPLPLSPPPQQPQQQQSLTLTQAHLLQLAAPPASSTSSRAGWLTQSLPSSAASSCPPSPDLSRHTHGFPSSPSPHSHSHSHTSAECFALHTPDSPTWKPSTLAHQCGMDLSARRRAREAVRGRESAGRLKMIGLSSRAQHARQAQGLSGPITAASSHAFLPQQHEGDYDSAGLSDLESTPSPLATPTTLLRRQLQRTALTHRIKPLMSSQGSLNMQTAMAAQVSLNAVHALPQTSSDDGSGSSFCASVGTGCGSFGAVGPASPEVDPALVVQYLQHLSEEELAATLQPIRSLLPVDTGADVTALASPPSASAYSRAASSSSDSDSSSSDSSSSSSSSSSSASVLHPPLALPSVLSLSSLHLSLVWTRCLARSQWRSTLPTDLMHAAFAFLDPATLLAAVMPVSKYWRNAANELVRGDAQWRAAVAAHRARLLQRCKMRVYRRLTVESLQLREQREED